MSTRRILTSPAELIRLAKVYAGYLAEPTADAYLAWGRLGPIVSALDPTQAFDLACHIVRAVPDAYRPTFVGGALAHLVHHHGEALIDWIEREAQRDVDFLDALSNAWVNGEGVHPTILIRLRVATRARIHIVRPLEHDAIYKGIFERWMMQHRAPSHASPLAADALSEPPSLSDLPPAESPPAMDPALGALHWRKTPWQLWYSVLPRLQRRISRMPRLVQQLAHGASVIWFQWFYLTTIRARLLLPVLLVVLAILSASPVADLMLVALAFVLATVVAALAGLVIGVDRYRRHQFPGALLYVGVVTLSPFVTAMALIARAEHGAIATIALVAGFVSRHLVGRLFRRARSALRHAPATGPR